MNYIGIDPGANGCIAAILDSGEMVTVPLKTATERDIAIALGEINQFKTAKAVIECVSSSPQMGVVSAFSFGRSYGFLRGCLAAAGIPYAEVRPQKWQKAMGCMSKGNKNVTKGAAQKLYPSEKVTHATADAMLLATFCRRHADQLF